MDKPIEDLYFTPNEVIMLLLAVQGMWNETMDFTGSEEFDSMPMPSQELALDNEEQLSELYAKLARLAQPYFLHAIDIYEADMKYFYGPREDKNP